MKIGKYVASVEALSNGSLRFFVVDETTGITVAEAIEINDTEELATILTEAGITRVDALALATCANDLLRTERIPLPPGWNEDKLSQYLATAHFNVRTTFHNYKPMYTRLEDIESIFQEFARDLIYPEYGVAPFFFFRSHAAFLSAAGLALGTQLPEAYMVMRGCLESSLYGYKVYKNPETAEIWLNRDDSADAKRVCRNTFGSVKPIFKRLEEESPELAQAIELLYERTIDFGAHPNQYSVFGNMTRTVQDGHEFLDFNYLNPDPNALLGCLKSLAQVGVCVLKTFASVFPLRYKSLGLNERIDKAATGL